MTEERRKKLRLEVFRRDGYRCFYCGFHADTEADKKALTLDHIIPRSKGGSDKRKNLVTACQPCNQRKGNRIYRHVAKVMRGNPNAR